MTATTDTHTPRRFRTRRLTGACAASLALLVPVAAAQAQGPSPYRPAITHGTTAQASTGSTGTSSAAEAALVGAAFGAVLTGLGVAVHRRSEPLGV
jgi:hypothetical protein